MKAFIGPATDHPIQLNRLVYQTQGAKLTALFAYIGQTMFF